MKRIAQNGFWGMAVALLVFSSGCSSLQQAFSPVTSSEPSRNETPWNNPDDNAAPPTVSEPTAPPTTGTSPSSQRGRVVHAAKGFLGTPYKYGGTTPSGFDCSGLTSYVFQQVGVSLPRVSREQAKVGRQVNLARVQPGDLVFFRRSRVGQVFHVGIVYRNTREGVEMIHSASSGVRIDNISNNPYWKTKHPTARRVLGR